MQSLLLNGNRVQIGPYLFQFVNHQLVITHHDDLANEVMRLHGCAALDLTDWLSLHRKALFEAVMRNDIEAFKAWVRADYALPEPEAQRMFVPPSSCNETLVELARAARITLCCDQCQQPLCDECYNCHNPRCRHCCERAASHQQEQAAL